MAQDPFKYFRPEATDLVDQFAKGVLALEKGEAATEAVRNLLRLAHTLKGAARVVRQLDIANLAHAIEDILSPHRDDGGAVKRDDIESVLGHIDRISAHIALLGQQQSGAALPSAKSEAEKGTRTVRTDVAETDAVLEGVTEAHALLGTLRNSTQGIARMRRLSDLLAVHLASAGGTERGRLAPGAAIAEDLRHALGNTERECGQSIEQMDRELRQLRAAAERLRLVAAASLFTAFERTARDVARAQGKEVTFAGSGGDIRLDAHVLEAVQGALIQIVRNAVAHGIEPPQERRAAGKPAAGAVSVAVSRRGRQIVFTCRDDGRGVDLDAVRRVAEQRGMLMPADAKTNAAGLMDMLLRGGISTSHTVTAMAGRGIGLDIVRESIERLGGKVAFASKPGQGTTFELVIPPSLSSMEALIVKAGAAGNPVSIPLTAVRGTMRLNAGDISHGSASATVFFDGAAIPFLPLATVLSAASWPAGRNWTAIVVAGAMGLAALGVDSLLGTGPTVVRALPDGVTANVVVAGASLDSEGNPQLVIDADGLVEAVYRGGGKLTVSAAKPPVLVVDDSMTTRMLEKSILESAGYDVDVALSGEEALECLTLKPYALILVDVEMPGIDGFTFIERLRADPVRHNTPAILVTSRASAEDLKRGRDVGANGHIVKSEFNQAELLATIERLIG